MVKSETASTDTAEYAFTVKEGGSGEPFIACEPRGGTLSILGKDAFLSLGVNTTSIEKAREIAKYLNDNISDISVTSFET